MTTYNTNKQKNYFYHIAYKIGTSTTIASQISGSSNLMGAILATQDADEGSMSPSDLVKLLASEVKGLGETKAQVFVDSYLEQPYTEPDNETARAVAQLIDSMPSNSPEIKWLLSKPSKYSKSPQQVIEENVKGRDGFWDAYLEHKITYDIAMKGYWLLSEDDDTKKESITKIFTAYKTLDEHEMQFNSPFLNAPKDGFDDDMLKQLGIMTYTDMGWIKTKTLASIRLIYKTMLEAKSSANEEFSKEDYDMFIEQGLMEDQAEAASKILNNRVSFLTGFAGVGKSFMLNKVLIHLSKEFESTPDNPKFFMTAIAGRAVKNFMDMIDVNSGVVGATMAASVFVKVRKKQLQEAKVVIIDEISMADINNVSRIIRIAKNAEKIIFIGDVAQLPAIQMDFYSKALHDGVINQISLTKPKRQKADSGILSDAMLIRNGKMPKFDKPDSQLGHASSIEQIVLQNPDARVFLVGTNYTAKKINDIKAKEYFDKALPSQRAKIGYDTYGTGTRFLVTKNNAQTGLMNGEIITLDVNKGVYHFVSEDGKLINSLDEKKHGLRLGFAITIHKSQGSTIDNVVTILDNQNMATRSLLYTAITRASQKHVLYEMKDNILEYAINKTIDYQDYDYQHVLDMNVDGIIAE